MKNNTLLAIFLFFGLTTAAQNTTFMRLAQVPGLNFGLSFTETSDGGMVGTGQDDGAGGHGICDLYVYKVDECGVTEWYKRYGGPAEDGGKYVTQLADGGYAVAALTQSSGAGGYDNWLLRLDGAGNLLWSKTFGTGASEHGRCVAEAPNGDLLLSGFVGAREGVLYRVDPTGNVIWQKQLSLANSTANYVEFFPNGEILLIGDFNGPYGLRDTYIARLDGIGNVIWAKQLGTTGEDGFDWDTGGRITSDGFIVSATMSGFGTGEDMTLSKFDPSGNVVWKKRAYGAGQDKAHFVNQTSDGGYIQSGFTTSWGFGGPDVMVNRFDPSGNHLWTRTYGAGAIDKGWGVQESADDGYLISALTTSFGALYYDPMFIKTDADGLVTDCPHVQTPPVTVVDANYSISNLSLSIIDVDYFTGDYQPTGIDIVPVDQLICFDCTNEPQFIISDTVLCEGESLYLINQTTVGLICAQEWFIEDSLGGNVSVLPGADTAEYIFSQAGFYNIVLNASCGGTTNSDTLTIVVFPKPDAGFEFQDACINDQPVSFNDTSSFIPFYWDWDFGDLTTGSGQSVQHSYSDTGYFDVTLMVETLFGCRDTITQQIDIHDKPNANFTVNDTCNGAGHQFFNSSISNDGSIVSHYWDFGDGGTSSAQDTVYSYSVPNTYQVELIVTTDNGCSDTIEQPVTDFTLPVAGFIGNPVCLNVPTVLEDATIPGDNLLSAWAWEMEGGTVNLNGASVQNTFPTYGDFPVQLVVTDIAGCIDSITQNITVDPRPVINISAIDTCALISFPFGNTSTIALGSIDSIAWDMDDGTILNNYAPFHTYAEPGSYMVTLYLESDNGCDSDTAFEVIADPNPIAGFDFGNVCDGLPMPFNETSTVPLPGVLQLSDWDMGNLTTLNDTVLNAYDYSTFGPYNVSLAVVTQHGCTDVISELVNVHPVPTAEFAFTNVCEDDLANFNDLSSVATGVIENWDWTFGNSDLFNGQSPGPQSYPADDLYPISLTVTSDSGCVNIALDTIEIYPVPIANFSFDSACFPIGIQFSDLSDQNGAYPITQFSWSFSDGQVSIASSPLISFDEFGAYSATLLVTNEWGCKGDSMIGDALVHPLPVSEFDANFGHCHEEEGWFNDQSELQVLSDDQIIEWVYDLSDGQSILTSDGTHFYLDPGFYPVELLVETNHGCRDSISHMVEVFPRPVVEWQAHPTNGCLPLGVQFSDLSSIVSPYSIVSWHWNLGDTAWSVEIPNPHFVFHPQALAPNDSAMYDISLTVISAEGCDQNLTREDHIVVHPLPEAFFKTDPNKIATIIEPIFDFTDLSTENVVAWAWEFGDGGNSDFQNPSHEYPDTGRFHIDLLVETAHGCTDHISYTVIVEPTFTFYIPNAFTPNSDDVNESFIGQGTGFVDFNMGIYDRWGELLYETANSEAAWDGTYKGNVVEAGEYVYKFRLIDWSGLLHEYIGGVTLIK